MVEDGLAFRSQVRFGLLLPPPLCPLGTKIDMSRPLHNVLVSALSAFITLVALEVVLRVADFRELRETLTEHSLAYDYDAELGWMPIAGSSSTMSTFRTTHYRHNSLGLRDDEFSLDSKPTILFLGDSFVWGLDSEAGERFSNLLRSRIPDHKILTAGVSGFGTDQEFLLLQRLWPKVRPDIVVLIFCSSNDRLDNSTNKRYFDYYKPYFTTEQDGGLRLQGQPVPRSQLLYYRDHWLVHHLWLARLATDAFIRVAHPQVFVPDPTEKLVGKMREYVEANGGRFFVGVQAQAHEDDAMTRYLEASHIPFTQLLGAEYYTKAQWGGHWTPEGHAVVAKRILEMLSANHAVRG
jgi:hypothetical protein